MRHLFVKGLFVDLACILQQHSKHVDGLLITYPDVGSNPTSSTREIFNDRRRVKAKCSYATRQQPVAPA